MKGVQFIASQAFVSQNALGHVRGLEGLLGAPLCFVGRNPHALRPTPPRKHKIADRAARKHRARAVQLIRWSHIEAGGSFKTCWFGDPANG